MNAYLKVKVASLAAEARIIRSMERHALKRLRKTSNWPDAPASKRRDAFYGLRRHRIFDVRREARSSSLAYGFLRGRAYRRLESRCHSAPNWTRVQQIIERFGEGDKRDLVQRFAAWKDAA